METYTMEKWNEDGTLKIAVGQRVAEDVVFELEGCVPPTYLGRGIFQVGEPKSTDPETYEHLYDTFTHDGEDWWTYRGECRYGETEHRKSWEAKYEEQMKKCRELARSLEPQQVGDLYYVGKDGERKTPSCLYFAAGYHMNKPGDCFTHCTEGLLPVYLSKNDKRLTVPEWTNMNALYKDGFIKNFYVE